MKITGNNISLAFLAVSILLVGIVSASSDYCTPVPNDFDITYINDGNWFNFTITSVPCYVCTDNGAGYGDVDCVPCADFIPVAGFSSGVTCGIVPFFVQFNDTSTGSGITDYYWVFGDGNTSTSKDPLFKYNTTGDFTISHSATNSYGTSWKNTSSYMESKPLGYECQVSAAVVYQEPNVIPLNPIVAIVSLVLVIFISIKRKRELP